MAAFISPSRSPYTEQNCEVRTTPLRAFNANVGILYLALAAVSMILAWFNSSKTGASTFDTNIYRLEGNYTGNNLVVPPSGLASLVTITPWGANLILSIVLLIGGLFHFIYATDFKRLYTLLLIDRCNTMRWVQFAIVHTGIALLLAQLMGTTTYDFMMFGIFALPCLGVLGYFSDRSYPCCPCMSHVALVGTALLFIGYWVPVITNFSYRYADSGLAPPAYMWIALFLLAAYSIFIFISPILQSRGKISYFILETVHALALLMISAIAVVCMGWALSNQNTV